MKVNNISIFAGLVATSTLALSAIPAQAFSLQHNNTGIIKFDKDTKVDFTFLESRGMFRSDFGIYEAAGNMNLVHTLFSEKAPGYNPGSNDAKNDWLGTCGIAVNPCTAWFTFKEGVEYKFGLTAPKGKTEYTAAAGTFDEGTAAAPDTILTGPMPGFISDAHIYNRSQVGPTAIKKGADPKFDKLDTSKYDFFVAINDSNKVDGDIQDFIVGANVKDVPEPAALGGLGLVAGAMTMLRRRKQNQN
jgi:hypothetical protein